jgi:hypothetical protein
MIQQLNGKNVTVIDEVVKVMAKMIASTAHCCCIKCSYFVIELIYRLK